MSNTFELARHYFPRLWNVQRIQALVDAGRLTESEAAEIIGDETEV